jgi:hypothetical protein
MTSSWNTPPVEVPGAPPSPAPPTAPATPAAAAGGGTPDPARNLNFPITGNFSNTSEITEQLSSMLNMRAFVTIRIFTNGNAIVIDSKDTGFNYIKSFSYGVLPNSEQVRASLYDDSGIFRNVMELVYAQTEKPNVGLLKKGFIGFEFGWCGLDENNQEKEIKSNFHIMALTNVEISYDEGGVNYELVGVDVVNNFDLVTGAAIYENMTVMNAIQRLVNTTHSGIDVVFGYKGIDDSLPPDIIMDRFEGKNRGVLEIIKSWISESGGVSRRGWPLIVNHNTVTNKVIIVDVPKELNSSMKANHIYGPHNVNFWENANAGIITKFTPKISGIRHVMSMNIHSYMKYDGRAIKISDLTNQRIYNTQEATIQNGGAVQPQSDSDENEVGGAITHEKLMRNWGAAGSDAEIEFIGWPKADVYMDTIGRLIRLNIMAPFGIRGERGGNLNWHTQGIDLTLSGDWLVKKIVHNIADDGYRMNVDVTRISLSNNEEVIPAS